MADGDDDRVVNARLRLLDRGQAVFVLGFRHVHPRVEHVDLAVVAAQGVDDVHHPGIAQVRAVFLERQAEHQHPRMHRVDALAQHQLDHLVGHVAAHAVVGAATGQDDLRVVAHLCRLVGQVVRIHADAVAADQARPERQEVPLGAGRFQHVQGVDAELVEQDGEVVDQRDVEVALGVLDHLGGFRHLDAGRLVGAGGDDAGVQRIDEIGDSRGGPGGHFQDVGHPMLLVAGVDALRAVTDRERVAALRGVRDAAIGVQQQVERFRFQAAGVADDGEVFLPVRLAQRGFARRQRGQRRVIAQAGHPLQDRYADFLGAARVDGGFVDHGVARLEHAAQGFTGLDQRGQVGPLGIVDRRGHGDDVGRARGDVGQLAGEAQPGGAGELFGIDFQRAVVAGLERFDARGVDVVTDGVVLLAELDGQRQADIAQADDGDAGGTDVGWGARHVLPVQGDSGLWARRAALASSWRIRRRDFSRDCASCRVASISPANAAVVVIRVIVRSG